MGACHASAPERPGLPDCALFVVQSGNDIGEELIFDGRDLVFQPELALLEALDLQLVGDSGRLEGHDFLVELTMLGAEFGELLAQLPFICPLHALSGPFPARVRLDRAALSVGFGYLSSNGQRRGREICACRARCDRLFQTVSHNRQFKIQQALHNHTEGIGQRRVHLSKFCRLQL